MENDVNLAMLPGLNKARQVMNATKVPQKSNAPMSTNENVSYSDNGMAEKPLPGMNDMLAERGFTNVSVPEYDDTLLYEDAVVNSKLPPHIKKLMSENRIKPASPVQEASVPEGAKRLMEMQTGNRPKPNPQQQQYQPQPQAQPQINFSKEEIKGMVKEVLAEMMMESISESAVKNALKKMMTEGKLKVKK